MGVQIKSFVNDRMTVDDMDDVLVPDATISR